MKKIFRYLKEFIFGIYLPDYAPKLNISDLQKWIETADFGYFAHEFFEGCRCHLYEELKKQHLIKHGI
jgi:hypothetical protein